MDASVSVIIPCYNCADTIHRAVESIVQQTLKPAEVILVDDGSADNTLQQLKLIQSKYGKDWIKVIALEKNTGVSNARNTAWDISSQNYIAFLDADDAWHSEKLSTQYSWAIAHPDIALCGHAYKLINCQDESRNFKIQPNLKTIVISKDQMLFANSFATPSVMLKRNLNYRFNPNQRYCEDYLLWLQICLDGHKVAMLDTELAYLFKSFGTSGLTSNLFRMRWGAINNYWQLWKSKRISFGEAIILIAYSWIKFIPLMIVGPKYYSKLNKRMIMKRFNGELIQ